jgi:hypothetical protein
MKKQLLILLLGMVVIGAGATGAWFYLTTAHEDDKPAASLPAVTRRIAYELEVTNTGGSPIQEERLMVRAPASTGRGQTCTTIQAGLPYELSRDEAGNQVLLFDLSIPPYGVKIIPFEAEVSWRPPAASGGGATATDYTHAEKYIELNHPALQAQAASLRRETTAATVTATFSWVSTQIDKTSYSHTPRGAAYAMRKKRGDCTEFMHLFISLCRINGIPARAVSGYVAPRDMRLTANDFHEWAEVYYDGRWHLADPYYGVLDTDEASYLSFFVQPGNADTIPFYRWHSDAPVLRVRML